MLVAAGSVDRAAELAQPLCPDTTQWLGAVFEAFGRTSQALQLLPGLSLAMKVNMCIKHAKLETLSTLLGALIEQERDSANLTVRAAHLKRQRGLAHHGLLVDRARHSSSALASLFIAVGGRHHSRSWAQCFAHASASTTPSSSPRSCRVKRYAIGIAAVPPSQKSHVSCSAAQQLAQAYACAEEWGPAFHTVKSKTATSAAQAAILDKWNASVAKPTAAWRTTLERQGMRPPTTVKLQPASAARS
jgi:hypothetical protein